VIADFYANELAGIMPPTSIVDMPSYLEARAPSPGRQTASSLACLMFITWQLRNLASSLITRLRNTEAELEKERNRT
jgi:hypothetical protein